jgi:hypothetical protein
MKGENAKNDNKLRNCVEFGLKNRRTKPIYKDNKQGLHSCGMNHGQHEQ